jgi:putative pyoverdin transport system ATP-binding/permease protein
MRHMMRARELFDQVAEQIRAMTEGTKELKMHSPRRRAFLGAVERTAGQLQEEERIGTTIFAAASSFGQVMFFLVIGFMVLVLPRFQAVSQWTLIAYTIVLFQIMSPLELLLSSFPVFSRGVASMRKVNQLGLSLDAEPAERESAEVLAAANGWWKKLELAGVTHLYRRENQDESFLLGPIDFAIEPGELVFLVGSNGSGKTTLAKLLIGLYSPESGEIRFAGQAVARDLLGTYREHFSVVFADFFVFKTLFGIEAGRLDGAARQYLSLLHLDSKVKVEDGALSTVDLSQGQRKRLALLTAYLEDRPIYVFDEWAADQDPMFKEVFYHQLLPELKARGKTVVVITHDDRYFHLADRIVKLDSGQVAGSWSKAEFAAVRGLPEPLAPQPVGTPA